MKDQHGRQVDYMRISITDRCNERCGYCMPADHSDWLPREQILSYEEILRVARVASEMGFRRFRITGGEPLVRRDVVPFISRLNTIPGVEHISMTTNATLLADVASNLHDAGLRSLNISLDSLDPQQYRAVTRGTLADAVAGIDAAVAAGFESIKLNTVLMKGVSEEQMMPIIRFAEERRLSATRFIELMPVSDRGLLEDDSFLSCDNARRILSRHCDMTPLSDVKLGAGPAKYWQLSNYKVKIGFIGAMTDHHFCESCNKVRLTADGFIRPCLGNHGERDLKPALRHTITRQEQERSESDAAVARVLKLALAEKPLEHVFRDDYTPLRIMTAIGG